MTQVLTESVSDQVRNYVRESYVNPANQKGEKTLAVNVGTVHKALKLSNRVPLVCAALKSRKFLNENGLLLVSQTGPASGQSTTVTFTYEILRSNRRPTSSENPFTALRGIAKDLFQKLGGGEAFIRSERNSFSSERGDEREL